MKEFKKSVQRHERKWLKYRLESCWRAYIEIKNKYFGKLKYKKKTSIQQKIQDCKNDTKKLHRLVTHLTGTEPRNPLPDDDANNDKDLANSFADFFQSKIEIFVRCLLALRPIIQRKAVLQSCANLLQ